MYGYELLPPIVTRGYLPGKVRREIQREKQKVLEEQDVSNPLVERDLALSEEKRRRDIEMEKQVISKKGKDVLMDETMRRVKQEAEVSTEEDLLEGVQRKKQYEEQVRRRERIVPNNELLRDIEVARRAVDAAKRLDSERPHIGPVIIGDHNRVKGNNTYNVVSDIHETLNRLKDEIAVDQEKNNLDQVKARMARTCIDKIKQEAVSTNPNRVKMLRYLKKVGRVTSYVTEKVTTAGKVITTFGEAANTIQGLFGKK